METRRPRIGKVTKFFRNNCLIMIDNNDSKNPSADHPVISPKERLIEKGLRRKVHASYRDMPWWKRTHEFTSVWDQTRRKRLGLLTTAFPSFRPRWEHPDWSYFNKARRLADAFGVHYEDWINVQFKPRGGGRLGGDQALRHDWHRGHQDV